MANRTGTGASVLRKGDKRFLAGRGTYVADIERPNMALVRSCGPHARMRGSRPLTLPGR
jgi:aerobic carbon-monoxide dehydrogenase large subunit